MPQHKSGAQKWKEKKKRDDNESRGSQTLFQVCMEKKQDDAQTYSVANFEELKGIWLS